MSNGVHTVRMPDIGEGIAEVELVEWRVKPGDTVAEDQVLCDVMTDKAAVEIPSPVAGRVLELGGEVGKMMAVGSVLIRIQTEGAVPAASAPTPTPAPKPAAVKAPAATPAPSSAPATAANRSRSLAAPAVRQRARVLGIDLTRVHGSGPEGRVQHGDLDTLLHSAGTAAPAVHTAPADSTREQKVIGLRRQIAQKMQASKRHIPHFTYVEECDVTELVALRDELNRQHGATRGELSPLVFVVRAVVRAVADHPQVNARFDDEAGVLTQHDAVHLGVATQTDGGLMVPVLRQAQTLDPWQTSAAIARLAAAARAGKATREDLTGSTITITSLGKLGGIVTTPVINRPEVAIVGVNRIVARPVVRDGVICVRQTMNLSSSFDHRVVDGAVAAEFIQQVRRLLEHPATLFVA